MFAWCSRASPPPSTPWWRPSKASWRRHREPLETLKAAQKRADQQRHELIGQAEELAAQLQARQLVETNVNAPAPPPPPTGSEAGKADEEKGGLGKMLSKMMQDPDTKEFIQQQQRMMMDQVYGPLVKQLGLTPEEATQFKDMLVDNGMKAAEKATSLMGDSAAPTAPTCSAP